MNLTHYLALALFGSLLGGCEPKVEPAKVEPGNTLGAKALEEPAAAAPVARAAPQPAPPAVPRARPEAARPEAKMADRMLPKAKLDLSLPPELIDRLNAEDSAGKGALAPLLPALFEGKGPAANPFQLSGRLITDEGDEDYWNSVEGAELQFEFKR